MVKNNYRGFSLIELLVVISLIGVVGGISLGQYSGFGAQKKLESDAVRFASVIEVARQRIISGDKSSITNPAACTLTATKVSYTPTSYTLIATCGADTTISSYQFESGIQLGSAGTVSFQPNGLPLQPGCIIVSQSSGSKCRKVSVAISGVVEVGAEATSCVCS